MKLKLSNDYIFPVEDASTTSLIITGSADADKLTADAFAEMDFLSDDDKLYGKYMNVYPAFMIADVKYVWYEGSLIKESEVPVPVTPEPEPVEPVVTVSLEDRINDLEIAVCEIAESLAE